MHTFASYQNPELRMARQELISLKQELAKLEGSASGLGRTNATGGKGIDSLALLREVKYHEVVFELLAKQYEMAKIDEAKDSSVVQVMDQAIEPDRKSKPRRSVLVLISALVAFISSVLFAFCYESFAHSKADPKHAARMEDLKRMLSWN
jgi:tyrosine-protein kinase Etk/Wzc